MPAVYDSVAVSSELVYKNFVHENIRRGWKIAPVGNIPEAPRYKFDETRGEEMKEDQKSRKPLRKGAELQLERMRSTPLNDTVLQVLKSAVDMVHFCLHVPLAVRKQPRTICGLWNCGSVENPSLTAKLSSNASEWTGENCAYAFCASCYGDAYPVERALDNAEADAGSSDSNSESSSSSSS